MKKHYLAPRLEAFELNTEQSIMTVSTGTLIITSLGSISSDGTGLEGMSGWGDTPESWTATE